MGAPDAHRLLAALAGETGSPIFGGVETFATDPAAVAVTLDDGALLDLVAAASEAGARGVLRQRDLAGECSFMVALASDPHALDSPWWSRYPPDRRLLVVGPGAVIAPHEGSTVHAVDLASGRGAGGAHRAAETRPRARRVV